MSIVAVQEPLGIGARGSGQGSLALALDPVDDAPDPAEQAQRVRTSIDHHRAEIRLLMDGVRKHRTALADLLLQRAGHAVELHQSGWQLASIGRLYQLTRERVRQIVAASSRTDVDDGAGVA